MAMGHSRTPRLKPFLDEVPLGCLVDSGWLKAHGIESKSIHRYASRGWLERVIRGVYRRPLPKRVEFASELSWESVLLSLQQILAHDIHLGGESALEFAGHYHYLRLGGPQNVHFFGDVPAWLKRLPTKTQIVVHRYSLFDNEPIGIGDSDRDAQGQATVTVTARDPAGLTASVDIRAIVNQPAIQGPPVVEFTITDVCNDGWNIEYQFFELAGSRPVRVWPRRIGYGLPGDGGKFHPTGGALYTWTTGLLWRRAT